tara:strand:- start:8730 stop:10004 length:1275 start_codon:yes stop_codon:yes gene_type:complete
LSYKKISVIGLGYIGLPTAAVLASKNKTVIGVDVNEEIIKKVNEGRIHIIEPHLEEIVSTVVKEGYLKATSKTENSDAFIIAVPTPFKKELKHIPEPDLKYIKSAANSIAPKLKKGNLIILESTSPVGTTKQLTKWLSELRPDLLFPLNTDEKPDVNIAYCPERVLPGKVIEELTSNDRVVGGMTDNCSKRAIQLYKIFVKGKCIQTDSQTAEMVKLTENSSRDVQIAFANELSILCDKLDINVRELISLANLHPRVNILQPGPGVGGHCIAVDPWFIVSKNPKEAKLIYTARTVNDSKPKWVIEKIRESIIEHRKRSKEKKEEDVRLTFYGMTFKADIDDIRESPALEIIREIISTSTVQVFAVEPNLKRIDENIKLISSKDANKNTDIAVLLVDHKEFKEINRPNASIIIDTKGIWEKNADR